MFDTSTHEYVVDQATIDHYVAKGRRERSRAIAEFFRSLFTATRAHNVKAEATS